VELPGNQRLGIIVGGSLSEGVEVKLDPGVCVEDMAVGRYVVVSGEKKKFFGMVTDVSLQASEQSLMFNPPDVSDPIMAGVVRGVGTYGKLQVLPLLALDGSIAGAQSRQPVKTVPAHFSVACEASQLDVELVFGEEDDKQFYIGTPLDMETKICLNLPEFVKRSNGVFGKSGTGKTFLTRLLLVGMLQKGAAVSLVFDMHSEYGWEGTSEGGYKAKGLKQLFPAQVAVFALDEENARRRRVSTDFIVRIGYDVDVYESHPVAGGVLAFGIPEYRMPDDHNCVGGPNAEAPWCPWIDCGQSDAAARWDGQSSCSPVRPEEFVRVARKSPAY